MACELGLSSLHLVMRRVSREIEERVMFLKRSSGMRIPNGIERLAGGPIDS